MHFNKLKPAEAERLALLLEEMGEAQQAIGKVLRHGYEEYHPDFPHKTNRYDLCRELGDVCAAMEMMIDAKDISMVDLYDRKDYKLKKVKNYLHHQ